MYLSSSVIRSTLVYKESHFTNPNVWAHQSSPTPFFPPSEIRSHYSLTVSTAERFWNSRLPVSRRHCRRGFGGSCCRRWWHWKKDRVDFKRAFLTCFEPSEFSRGLLSWIGCETYLTWRKGHYVFTAIINHIQSGPSGCKRASSLSGFLTFG